MSKNTEAYNSYSSIVSDHRLVAATVKLSLRSNNSQPRKVKYDWGMLRWDRELQEKYIVEVHTDSRYCQDPSQDSRVIQSRETVTEAYKSYHQIPES